MGIVDADGDLESPGSLVRGEPCESSAVYASATGSGMLESSLDR
jgi:hypothetical protein